MVAALKLFLELLHAELLGAEGLPEVVQSLLVGFSEAADAPALQRRSRKEERGGGRGSTGTKDVRTTKRRKTQAKKRFHEGSNRALDGHRKKRGAAEPRLPSTKLESQAPGQTN